ISEWIGQLKGSSSYHINHEICNRRVLGWQDGYGVVSFGTRDLPWVVAYVRNQKKHHAEGTTHDRLERTDQVDPPSDCPDTNSDGSRDGDEETR
ncbi:MAG: transposase, partial [Phycisphaerae bacterium]|nr:transposase [Phycisphaerae bacterium]